jgi:hypothetical protein
VGETRPGRAVITELHQGGLAATLELPDAETARLNALIRNRKPIIESDPLMRTLGKNGTSSIDGWLV